MIKTQPLLTIDDCIMNPQNIYVFGDNLTSKGTAGQAIIRGCPNALGVPTNILPTNKIGSGLAKIEHYSPKIASLIDRFYSRIEV